MNVTMSAFLALLVATIFPVVEAQSDDNTGVIAGLVVALILIKIVFIITYCLCRRSRTQSVSRVILVTAEQVTDARPDSSETVPRPFEGGAARPEVSLAMPPPPYSEVMTHGTAIATKSNVV
ncbi:hypothetical protein LSAT2_021927 [Lamellibrachia satsuma]|nr:hypothetical protein LSAT2_021927 [Lamellibrachia satsuma]